MYACICHKVIDIHRLVANLFSNSLASSFPPTVSMNSARAPDLTLPNIGQQLGDIRIQRIRSFQKCSLGEIPPNENKHFGGKIIFWSLLMIFNDLRKKTSKTQKIWKSRTWAWMYDMQIFESKRSTKSQNTKPVVWAKWFHQAFFHHHHSQFPPRSSASTTW